MGQSATFLIAQHIPDPFRREPRNIGVFVQQDGQITAKFFGEIEAKIDPRKTRVLPFPDVYSQWVGYWRRTLLKRSVSDAWNEIKATAKDHYQIVEGGTVDGIAGDSIDDVVMYLYSALVSEGGIASAIGAPDETEAAIRLADAVEDQLRARHLLMTPRNTLFAVHHPVGRDIPVKGASATHILSFVQRNGHDVVMEPIDLGVKRDKRRMKERAGWASRVFEDVREEKKDTETIALISASPDEAKENDARYALDLLRPYTTDIVNWQLQEDRDRFIAARAALASAD